MISAVWFVVAASIGIDVGWQPVENGGYEFLLQIEPEQLERLKAGEALTSDLPELPGRVVRVHWLVGTDPLPQTTLPAASPQDATPSNALPAAETPPAESPTTADRPGEATTANRPIAPTVPGELSLTDGRTATNANARGAASLGDRNERADTAADQPELALAAPRSSEAAVAAETRDAWHSAAPSTSEEPAPVAATSYEELAGVGPVDPGETNVDLSDGLDDTNAVVAPRLDKQLGYVAVASPFGNSAPSGDSASAAAALEHRARPNTSATATGDETATDTNHDGSTAITGASGTDEPPAGDEVVATSSPRPLAWLAAITTLGASLAGNVFFFWGFVDAKRRYRTALRDSGLLPA
jgi:hypothetical protein